MTTKKRIPATDQSHYIAQYALCRKAEDYYTKVCVASKNKTEEHVSYAKKIHEEVLHWAGFFTRILNQEGGKFKLYSDANQREEKARNRYTNGRELSLHRNNRGAVVGALGAVAAGSAAAAYAGDDDDYYHDYGPATNIDGTPMIPNSGVDIHGHSYGTSPAWTDNSWSGGGGGWSGGGWSDD